ncbi:MAG: GtrA family protein, partial [Vicinamibacterales bacterium]
MSPRLSAFLVVGAIGFVVQMVALFALASRWHVPYALATALAVEAAVLHNFVWHECWTWKDRQQHGAGCVRRLLRFNLGTGLTSVVGNIIGTVVGVELLHMPTLVANGLAVVATSLANFMVADRWVFGRRAAATVAGVVLLAQSHAAAADLKPETLAAWHRHIAVVESTLQDHQDDPPVTEPQGRTYSVQGGSIHEWRGSATIKGITTAQLVRALQSRGLPPPAEDILDARVLERDGDRLRVYMKITRSAIVTVTYDTEH